MRASSSMRRSAVLGFVVVLAFSWGWTELAGADGSAKSIVPENAELKLLFDGGFFLEGPAVGPDGTVFFSDITNTAGSGMQAGHIWRHDPNSGDTTIFRSPSGMANGIIFDLEDRMVVAQGADFGGRCVTRTDMSTGKSEIIAGLYNGRSFNSPNDLAIDEQGRIYFTDPRYVGHEPIELARKGYHPAR